MVSSSTLAVTASGILQLQTDSFHTYEGAITHCEQFMGQKKQKHQQMCSKADYKCNALGTRGICKFSHFFPFAFTFVLKILRTHTIALLNIICYNPFPMPGSINTRVYTLQNSETSEILISLQFRSHKKVFLPNHH